jgi:hypothetical protein
MWVLWRREAFCFLYRKSNHSRPARSRVTNTTPVPGWGSKYHKRFCLSISMIIDTSFCVKTKIYSLEQSSGPPNSTVWFTMDMLHFPEDKAAGAWHWLPVSYSFFRSVFWQVHNPFQREFSTECDLVITLSISLILSFPCGHPVAVYVIFLVFPSLLFFSLLFLK